jgi:CRP/FNR family cyclic AMP-dependent transcriptional regulator
METIPRFSLNVARLLAVLSGESIMRIGPLVLDPTNMRLASTLNNLAALDEADSTGQSHVIIGLSQGELAKVVGASRTWVVLTLAEFDRLRLLERRKRGIRIPDLDRLMRYLAMERRNRQGAVKALPVLSAKQSSRRWSHRLSPIEPISSSSTYEACQ